MKKIILILLMAIVCTLPTMAEQTPTLNEWVLTSSLTTTNEQIIADCTYSLTTMSINGYTYNITISKSLPFTMGIMAQIPFVEIYCKHNTLTANGSITYCDDVLLPIMKEQGNIIQVGKTTDDFNYDRTFGCIESKTDIYSFITTNNGFIQVEFTTNSHGHDVLLIPCIYSTKRKYGNTKVY